MAAVVEDWDERVFILIQTKFVEELKMTRERGAIKARF
jgi:hypothetical protein